MVILATIGGIVFGIGTLLMFYSIHTEKNRLVVVSVISMIIGGLIMASGLHGLI
jgi:uncharacterized membrane protein